MSQENVELIRRGYEAFAEDGVFSFEFLDPEIEWLGPRQFPDLAEPHYGHDGVRRYMENPTAHLWTIRGSKAVRLQSYWERSEALEAAGLRE